MKISEIVTEASRGKLRKATTQALSNITSYPYLDNNSHPYVAYRFGVALAKSPNDVKDQIGPIGSEFTTLGYSKEDQEIIDHARKEFGLATHQHSTEGSVEVDSINKTSPVAKPKKNKYGI
jgi:hypothetical protein